MSQALIQYAVYSGADTVMGNTTIDLPAINMMTQELKGAGIGGAIDMPILGMAQAMSVTFNWRTVTQYARKLEAPKRHELQLYAAVQDMNQETGDYVTRQHLIELWVIPKNLTLGKLDPGTTQDRTLEYEVLYFKESYDGVVVREINKFTEVFIIDGKDYFAEVRKALGRG